MKGLQNIFHLIKRSVFEKVSGVQCFNSGIDGPCVGITICTHGNEPCGLAVAKQFLDGLIKPKKGKVFIVINNILATENYFNSKTEGEKLKCRYVDVNMNRLPEILGNENYEEIRAKELLPIWSKFDYALDIHSTSQPSDSIIIEGVNDASNLTKNFPSKIVLRNMLPIQLGIPAIGFYNQRCISIGYEAGSHETNEAQINAIQCVESLLISLDMLDGKHEEPNVQNIYTVHSSVMFPDENYRLKRIFPMFDDVKKGEVVALNNNGGVICSPVDGVAIFAPKGLKPNSENEEVLYICEVN